MRTTIRLDDDIAAAAEQLRLEQHIGLGEAVNQLARSGLAATPKASPVFTQRTAEVGLRVDVANIADVLELLDEHDG